MDDVNFAEIVAIFSMSDCIPGLEKSEGFLWGTNNYDDFENFLVSDDCKPYMYELGLKWTPIYRGQKDLGNGEYETIERDGDDYDSPEACANAPETRVFDGVLCHFEEFYIKSFIKPFGLREEFKIAFYELEPKDAYEQDHLNFSMHSNGFILNYAERTTRLYQRDYKKKVTFNYDFKNSNGKIKDKVQYKHTVNALGPPYDEPRSKYSSIYEELLNDEWLIEQELNGQGRSAWFYIEKTYNKDLEEIDWGTNELPEIFKGREGKGLSNVKNLEDYLEWLKTADAATLLEIARFFQGDPLWKDFILGYNGTEVKTISSSGCGFTSMAMIASFLTGQNITPDVIGSMFSQYYKPGIGMDYGLTTAVANHYGFNTTINNAKFDALTVAQQLNAGNPVLVRFGPGDYTKKGHLAVITGVTNSGDFIVNDPNKNNYNNYGNVYSKESMAKNATNMWAFSK